MFHAGTGTLTPYNALLSYIEKDSKENEAIIGFTFGDDADYISMETSQTFRLLGEKYGKILNKLGYSNYILIGHCVGGLIALETAQYLQKKNVQVSDVTLISSNIPKQKNQTILSQATDEIYRKTLQSSLDNEILLERIFAKLIGADAYKAGYQVDEERLQQYIEYIVDQGTGDITVEALCNTGGKFEDVAKEFRLLASKSVSERLNALYNIIERPNGELMEHQLKMLNILFRVFSQNFRCVSTYEPKPYYGNMRIGASIAIEIALRDCIRINKLILDGGQFESMGIMKKIDAYFMAKEFQKVIQKKRMWSYVSKQMGYRNGNEIEVLYPLCCKRIQFDTLYDAALAAYGYDIKKRMEKLRMKVVIMYGGNELFAAKSVSLVKEKCVSECEVYAYDNMGHSEVLSLHPEKLCEIIRK